MSSKKKLMITIIVAILLIGSAITLTLSPFQRASAQGDSSAAQKKAQQGFGFGGNNGQQQTTNSNPAQTKGQEAFNQNNRLTGNTNQGQQQPPQLEPEENVGNKVSDLQNKVNDLQSQLIGGEGRLGRNMRAPIATSGDNNVYIAWWSNKTGNNEVMFKASTDGGKTFSDTMNLSNSPTSDSQDVQISAAVNNVYVTWWERNATSNEPVLRVSNDNGKTFGEKIMLSSK